MTWIIIQRFHRGINRAIPASATVYLTIGIIHVVVLSGVFKDPLNPGLSPVTVVLLTGFWPFILSPDRGLPLIAAGVITGSLLYNPLSQHTRLPRQPAVFDRVATWAQTAQGKKIIGSFLLAEPLSRVTTGIAIVGARTLMYPNQYELREFSSHATETIVAISDEMPHIMVFTGRVVGPPAFPSSSTIFDAWANGYIRSSDVGVFVGYPSAVLIAYCVVAAGLMAAQR